MLIRQAFLIISIFTATAAFGATCPSALFKPYKSSGGGFYYIVDLPKDALRARPHSQFKFLSRFQSFVKHKTSVNPIDLLQKQLGFYRRMAGEQDRFEKVIEQRVGRIRDISCLEAFLFDSHLSQFRSQSEFLALIFTHKDSRRVRALVSSQNRKDGVSFEERMVQAKASLYSQGWSLEIHLHNHPFSFDNPYGDIAGTVLPSQPDLASYRQLRRNEGLKSARITNGFSTLELRASEFGEL